MKKQIKRFIVFELVIFIAAIAITVFVGEWTVDRYGLILILCGLVPMAMGVVSEAGSRQRPMPYSYRPKTSVAQQHAREKQEILARTTFLQNSLIIGAVPVAVGLLLMQL